jgi:antitoxin MazE
MMTVMVKKLGGSVAVVIPKAVAQEMQLTDGTALELSTSGDGILMRRRSCRPRRSMKELVAQIKPASYRRRRRELEDGGPVGKEFW